MLTLLSSIHRSVERTRTTTMSFTFLRRKKKEFLSQETERNVWYLILFDLLLWHITISETFGTTFVHLEIHSNANTDYYLMLLQFMMIRKLLLFTLRHAICIKSCNTINHHNSYHSKYLVPKSWLPKFFPTYFEKDRLSLGHCMAALFRKIRAIWSFCVATEPPLAMVLLPLEMIMVFCP